MKRKAGPKNDPVIDSQILEKAVDGVHSDQMKLTNSRMVVDACRPYERLDTFPKVATSSKELAAQVRAKYPELYR